MSDIAKFSERAGAVTRELFDVFGVPKNVSEGIVGCVERHLYVSVFVSGALGALMLANIAGSDTARTGMDEAVRMSRFGVMTREGPVECYGEVPITLDKGDTVAGAVQENTILAIGGPASRQVDLAPVANAVAGENGFPDASMIPANTGIVLPYACGFAP